MTTYFGTRTGWIPISMDDLSDAQLKNIRYHFDREIVDRAYNAISKAQEKTRKIAELRRTADSFGLELVPKSEGEQSENDHKTWGLR